MNGKQTALLVVDVQNELFQHAIPIYHADRVLANINLLITSARAAGAPVVFIQHSCDDHLIEDTAGWQVHPNLQPLPTDVMIRKKHASSFEETPLRAELERRGVGTLVICGLVTHGCVKATCRAALDLGYSVIFTADAHSSYSKDAARLIEEWNSKLGDEGAQVKTTEDIIKHEEVWH